MGDRNHLHVCRHCGNVMATSSSIGPRSCSDCSEDNFSLFLVVPDTVVEDGPELTLTWRLYGQFAKEAGVKEAKIPIEWAEDRTPTIRDAVNALIEAYPTLKERVIDPQDEVRRNGVIVHNHMHVYADRDHLETPVETADTLGLFPRIR